MARICRVCAHPCRAEIDTRLVSGESPKQLADLFNLPKTNVFRHRDGHIAKALVKAAQAVEVARTDELVTLLRELIERTQVISEKAEEAGDLRTAVTAIRELRGNLELLAKLSGQLEPRSQTSNIVNVNLDPETALRMARIYVDRRKVVEGECELSK